MDALIGDTKAPEDLAALFRFMQKRLAERILAGELTDHLGYAAGEAKPPGQTNYRSRTTPMTVLAEIEQTEGASSWLHITTELKSRGVEDILIALVDGLVGFPEAITTVFPSTQVHHCVVHLVRQSLAFASRKERNSRERAPHDLPRFNGARGRGAGRVCGRRVRPEVPGHRRPLAPALAVRGANLCHSARDPTAALHDECDRESPQAAPEDRENPRALSDGRGRDQTVVSRAAEHRGEMAPREPRLEGGDALSGPTVCTTLYRSRLTTIVPHTQEHR